MCFLKNGSEKNFCLFKSDVEFLKTTKSPNYIELNIYTYLH